MNVTDARALVVVRCEECQEDKRDPDRLGELRSTGDRWVWVWRDKSRARAYARRVGGWSVEMRDSGVHGGIVLRDPRVSDEHLFRAEVPGTCRKHGSGMLDTAAILALGQCAVASGPVRDVLRLRRTT